MYLGQFPFYPYPWTTRNLVYPYTQHVTDTWLDPNDPADRIRMAKKRQRAVAERNAKIIAAVQKDSRLSEDQKQKIIAKLIKS